MTDLQWLDAVDEHARQYGFYAFSDVERKKLARYVRGDLLNSLHLHRLKGYSVQYGLVLTLEFTAAMRKGLAAAVTAKLCGNKVLPDSQWSTDELKRITGIS